MVTFDPVGPVEVPFSESPGGREISADDVRAFWSSAAGKALKAKKGCYVFALRAGKGFTPYYVGMATKGFGQEIFTPDKLTKYHRVFMKGKKGTPVFFFTTLPTKPGQDNLKAIKEQEKFLIGALVSANPDHVNKKNTRGRDWAIKGVFGSGRGKPSKSAAEFKRCMNL